MNLVGKVPPLEASGAAVTLVHPTATTVVGQWDVTYPQDMPEEQRPNLGPTRTFGYAHRLVEKPPRFARRHVRRDVQIDARDKNGWSNAEAQMDSAARELSGDVVFQRTLTGDDLGALVPNVDFKQGDVLPLMVWGMIVPATCTSIRYTLDDGRRTVEVGFGPSLTADRDGLAESMSQIDRQMRAEAAGIDEYLAKQLDEAKAASDQQMDGLKTYVDEQDTAARTHADTVAGNALTTARKDAQGYADTAQSQAEQYARRQDVENLKSAKEYAKDQFDEAQKALTNYREQVTGLIGEQGTITKDLANLNSAYTEKLGATGTVLADLNDLTTKYTDLSNDFTAKVGENGTLVRDQNNTANVLDAMINGTSHNQLTGTQFQQQQNAVNLMQSAFNQKQVDINTGFQGLFDAQAVTNAMQAEFNKKQVGINTGFQNLFEAQAYTNSMQLAFNKKQTGINSVYDAMWEEQNKRDLLQEYLIEYNKIMAEAGLAKFVTAKVPKNGTYRLENHPIFREIKFITMGTAKRLSLMIVFHSAAYPFNLQIEVDYYEDTFVRKTETITTYPVRATSDKGVYLLLPADNFDFELTDIAVRMLMTPTKVVPFYQEKADALAGEYRAKGLNV